MSCDPEAPLKTSPSASEAPTPGGMGDMELGIDALVRLPVFLRSRLRSNRRRMRHSRRAVGGLADRTSQLTFAHPAHEARTPDPRRSQYSSSRRSLGELFAELANEHVDDLLLRLVHAAVELVEEHLFRDRMALAQARSSSIPYSLPVSGTVLPAISACLALRLHCQIAAFMSGSAWPIDRRTIAWMRAIAHPCGRAWSRSRRRRRRVREPCPRSRQNRRGSGPAF